MHFSTAEDFIKKYPLVMVIKNITSLQQRLGFAAAEALSQDNNERLNNYLIPAPKDALLNRILREKPIFVVRSFDGTIPYMVGYTAFSLKIGEVNGASFTALVLSSDLQAVLRPAIPAQKSVSRASTVSSPTQSPAPSPVLSLILSKKKPRTSDLLVACSALEINVSIYGLELACVLLQLYNNASCEGPVYDNDLITRNKAIVACSETTGKLQHAERLVASGATTFIAIDLGFGLRHLGVSIIGSQFDALEYDSHHNNSKKSRGQSKAAVLIEDLYFQDAKPMRKSRFFCI